MKKMKRAVSGVCVLAMLMSLIIMPQTAKASDDEYFVNATSAAGTTDTVQWYNKGNGWIAGGIINMYDWQGVLETAGWNFSKVIEGDSKTDFEISFDFNAVSPETNMSVALGTYGETLNGFSSTPNATESGYHIFNVGSVSGSDYTLGSNVYLNDTSLTKNTWYTVTSSVSLSKGTERHIITDRTTGEVIKDTDVQTLRTGSGAWESTKDYNKIRFTVSKTGNTYGNLTLDNVSVKEVKKIYLDVSSNADTAKNITWYKQGNGYIDVGIPHLFDWQGHLETAGWEFNENISGSGDGGFSVKFDFNAVAPNGYMTAALGFSGEDLNGWDSMPRAYDTGYRIFKVGTISDSEFSLTANTYLDGTTLTKDTWYTVETKISLRDKTERHIITDRETNDVVKDTGWQVLRMGTGAWETSKTYDKLRFTVNYQPTGHIAVDNAVIKEMSLSEQPKVSNVVLIDANGNTTEDFSGNVKQFKVTFSQNMIEESVLADGVVSLKNSGEEVLITKEMTSATELLITAEEELSDVSYTLSITKAAISENGTTFESEFSEDFNNVSQYLLKGDFDNSVPTVYGWDYSGTANRGYYDVLEDADENKYGRVSSYLSSGGSGSVADGFKFSRPLEWGKQYKINFDFAIENACSYDMIALVDDLPKGEGGSYNAWSEFALAEIKSGEMYVNEEEVTKENSITWNINTESSAYWYNYDMDIDMLTREYSVTITDKSDTSKKAYASGTLPALEYYGITVGCTGIIWFDNVEVYEIFKTPTLSEVKFVEKDGNAVGVLTENTKKIQFTFDEEMNKSTLDKNLYLTNETEGMKISFTSEISDDKKTYLIKPSTEFVAGDEYSILVSLASKSVNGVALDKSYSYTFDVKECHDLLDVDFDTVSYVPSELVHSSADVGIKDGHLEITTNYANTGYPLNGVISDVNREYILSFDFKFLSDEFSGYPIMLAEKATIKGTASYSQFGAFGINSDKAFQISDIEIPGIKPESGKWYNYHLIFNPKSTTVDVKITDIENPERVASYKGAVGDRAYYGEGMPKRNYDLLQFTYKASMAIDNITIKANDEKPVFYKVTSDHVGNMFGGSDDKKLNITLENMSGEDITADVYYTVYYEDGAVIDEGKLGSYRMTEKSEVSTSKIINIEKYGTYKIQFKTEVDGKEYLSEKYDLSVINKRDEDVELNDYTAVNTPYIRNMNDWYDFKEALTQAGIKSIRKDLNWNEIETEKGVYSIPSHACYFEDLADSGLEYMAILNATTYLYSEDGSGKRPDQLGTDEAWAAWEGYVDYVSKVFKGKIKYYEIINEPTETISVSAYPEYMRRAKAIIDKNDPDAIVCGFSTASMPWWWITGVLNEIRSNPSAYLDILTVHPYDFHNSDYAGNYLNTVEGLHWGIKIRDNVYKSKVVKLHEYMSQYNTAGLTVHSTEMAVTSTPGVSSVRSQAADLAQLYTINMAGEGIEKMYWYCFENTSKRGYDTVIPNDTEGNFGLVGSMLDPVPLAAKPSYVALAGFNSIMTGAEFEASIDKAALDVYKFLRPDGDNVAVLWSEEATDPITEFSKNITLNLGCTSVEVFDMYSNSLGVIESADGIYSFAGSLEPIYIIGSFSKFEEAQSGITLSTTKFNIPLDGERIIEINDSAKRALRVEAEGNAHINIVQTQNVENGSGYIKVKGAGGAGEEQYVDIKIYDGETLIYCSRIYAFVEKTFLDSVLVNGEAVENYISSDVTDVTLKINGENLSESSTAKIVIGYYDAEGRMMSVKTQALKLVDRGFTDVAVTFDSLDGVSKINFMVLGDSFAPYSNNLVYFIQ